MATRAPLVPGRIYPLPGLTWDDDPPVTPDIPGQRLLFDNAVTSGPGDFWRFAPAKLPSGASYRLFRIEPGQSRVITAVIKPSAPAGTVVRGTLYVDDFAASAQFVSGSQLLALPYEYRVG